MYKCFCDKCGKEISNIDLNKCTMSFDAYGIQKVDLIKKTHKTNLMYDLCVDCAVLVHRYIVNSMKEDEQ